MALKSYFERLFLLEIWLVLLFRLTFATANEETPHGATASVPGRAKETSLVSEMSLRREAILLR